MRNIGVIALSAYAGAQNVVPEYVTSYAPLVHLDINEQYYPGDIGAQLRHTHPTLNFNNITNGPSNLTLSNLSQLNTPGTCTITNSTCPVYLTSTNNVTVGPPSPSWLYGVLPDPITGETKGAISCTVIIVNHTTSTSTPSTNYIDAFYLYFYPFNLGLNVSGTVFDDHVGDWEHTMVRFLNGAPQTVYYSIHSAGETYTYDSVLKNSSRPLAFSSLGGHASYAVPGRHAVALGIANDTSSYGPLWDPVRSAYFYSFTPASFANFTSRNGTFTPLSVSGSSATTSQQPPTDWLYYLGRWGDKQYPSSYPGQHVIANVTATFTDGPTGPVDKDLYRKEVCPDSSDPSVSAVCVTTSVLPAVIAGVETQTVSRSYTVESSSTATGLGGKGSATAAATSDAVVAFAPMYDWMFVALTSGVWAVTCAI